MLDLFRKRGLSNIVYGVIILAMILVFVINFRPDAGKKAASCVQKCTVVVRGWCIEPKSYNAALSLMMPKGQEMPTQRMAQFRDLALKGLVERELLISEAERVGLSVSDAEVTDQIIAGYIRMTMPTDDPAVTMPLLGGHEPVMPVGFKDLKTKEFDINVYKRTIRNLTGLSENDFREEQKRELLATKMRDVVRTPIRVSEAEAYGGYIAQYNTATVTYVPVKQSYAARWGIAVTDADVTDWMKDHQAEVDKEFDARKAEDLPKEGRIRHILAKVEAGATPEEKAAGFAKISETYARLKAGEPFPEVARQVTDDQGSKATGGGYDKDKLDGFVDAFKKAADALAPGEMTAGAIETQFGYHILSKDDPSKSAELEPAIKKAIARELLNKDRAATKAKDLASRIASGMVSGQTADEAIKAVIATLSKPTRALVAIKVLNEDEAQKAAAAASDAGAQATGDASPASSADAAAAGDASLTPTPMNAKAPAGPLAAYKPLTAETDPDRPQPQTTSPFNQQGDPPGGLSGEAASAFVKFAFSAKDGATLPEPLATPDGLMVVQLKERHTTSKDDFAKGRDVYLSEMLTKKQAEALALYVKQLRETAEKAGEIKIDKTTSDATDGGAPAAPPDLEEEGP